jgi:hypothetical protein
MEFLEDATLIERVLYLICRHLLNIGDATNYQFPVYEFKLSKE